MLSDGSRQNNKRTRTVGGDTPSSPNVQDVRLGDGLRQVMGGRKFCKEDELTRAVLLSYLKAEGEVAEVNLAEVTVQTMAGTSFGVMVEAGKGVSSRVLKAEIEEAEGTPQHQQELFFVVGEGSVGGHNPEPLGDDSQVTGPCTVALCVHPAAGECCGGPFRVHGSEVISFSSSSPQSGTVGCWVSIGPGGWMRSVWAACLCCAYRL